MATLGGGITRLDFEQATLLTANKMTLHRVEIVGPVEIGELLDVKTATVHSWRWRDQMPQPDAVVSGHPIWLWPTVEAWARKTGRLP